jgi:hypothetical protein
MNIKELKEAIKDLPDDMLVFTEHWESSDSGTSWPREDEAISASPGTTDKVHDPKYPHFVLNSDGNPKKSGRFDSKRATVFIIH